MVADGELLVKNFEKTKLSPEDFMMSMHQNDVNSLDEVENVWYEPSGELTIDRVDDEDKLSHVIISNGKLVEGALGVIHKDEAWLNDQLKQNKKYEIKDIFMAEWHDEKLWIHPFSDHEDKIDMHLK